jgi:hypothetical protein
MDKFSMHSLFAQSTLVSFIQARQVLSDACAQTFSAHFNLKVIRDRSQGLYQSESLARSSRPQVINPIKDLLPDAP